MHNFYTIKLILVSCYRSNFTTKIMLQHDVTIFKDKIKFLKLEGLKCYERSAMCISPEKMKGSTVGTAYNEYKDSKPLTLRKLVLLVNKLLLEV